ncbi:MAG: hypothetical protein CENE_03157 [Candidatus Celerinatantimonas neptuna]|nr:MAG: hypothetical protein CENE_03157 [Candidatus Celerinatantimonas neptuna]
MYLRSMLIAVVSLPLLLLSGCASKPKPVFYWGDYETLIYQMYMKPGSADPATQISKLTVDIQKAHAKGLPIAPGIHAHLGYMYILDGKPALAREEFLKEKQLYPESASFIDGIIKRMDEKKK